MKRIKIIALATSLASSLIVLGQNNRVMPKENDNFKTKVATKSSLIQAELFKDLSHQKNDQKWATTVRPTFSRKHTSSEIQAIKDAKWPEKLKSYQKDGGIEPKTALPIVGMNYEANWSVNAAPADNSMAVSNGGFVVTANNDGCEYYNSAGTLTYSQFWNDFFSDGTLTSNLYDPKVIYDSQEDRFILIVLHGSTGTTSKVIVSFSKTNNPNDGWWVYKLSGNPLGNDC